MNATKPNFEKLSADAASHGKEQFDAFVQFGTAFARGAEDFLKTYLALSQSTAEKNAENVKALLGCKTINELTETQNKLAQEGFDSYINGVSKLSELGIKTATESFEPINAHFSKTIKKATDSVAA